jgi:N-acetylmuramoyl-L-alanine amidase CwlA
MMKTLSLHMQANNGVSTNMRIVYVAPVQNKAGIHFMLNLSDQKVIIIQIVISNNSFFETFCLIN